MFSRGKQSCQVRLCVKYGNVVIHELQCSWAHVQIMYYKNICNRHFFYAGLNVLPSYRTGQMVSKALVLLDV